MPPRSPRMSATSTPPSRRRWVDEGRTRHFALVPAADPELVDAWFRLSFGQQQAHATREVDAGAGWPAGVRRAEPRDVDALVELEPAAPASTGAGAGVRVQARSRRPRRGPRRHRAGGRKPGDRAASSPRPRAASSGASWSARSRCRPPSWGCAGPRGAATWRGRQRSRRSEEPASASRSCRRPTPGRTRRATRSMTVDWRVANLLASRFWLRRGFRLTFLRLSRSIP